ncbi:lasso peptide biosynthesis B2 protein [Streptomyces sp. NPDC006129]|uniref:lasso peptide biosynthesis B2 protein n=1 Tax=unclassified Streptomyces TaxID=2593676 RepID=UPI0033197C05
MSSPEVVAHAPRAVPPLRRLEVRLVVAVARLLATRRPRRVRTVLERLSRGARPATVEETRAARDAVVAVSLACAGREGCLPRSLATALLCRLRGRWPTWCVGARRLPPFGAHAWVEAEGVPVGEEYPPGYFRPLFTVACAEDGQRVRSAVRAGRDADAGSRRP